MHDLRRFFTRCTIGGCLAVVFAAGLPASYGQDGWRPARSAASVPSRQSQPQNVILAPANTITIAPQNDVYVAPAPAYNMAPAGTYNVWEDDDGQTTANTVPAAKNVSHEKAEKAAAVAADPPPRELPKSVRDAARPVPPRGMAARPAPGRAVQAGYHARPRRVVGAHFQDDPSAEPLPDPAPMPLGPGGGVPGAPESVLPKSVLPGGRVPGGRGMSGPYPDGPSVMRPGPGGPPMMGPGPGGPVMMSPGPGGPVVMGDEVVEGEMPFGGDPFADSVGPGCSSCEGGGCGDCGEGGCGAPCGGGYWRECFPCLFMTFRNLDIFSGVHGFTNSTNRAGTGSFGYHVGFNKGRPMVCLPCSGLSMQYGMSATLSNFEGATFATGAPPGLATTTNVRNQIFVTGGLFRRADCGLQGGVVVDFLRDDWYAKMNVVQLRGELSYLFPESHELGFWCAVGVKPDTKVGSVLVAGLPVPVNEGWEAIDLYAAFYRYRLPQTSGQARSFVGLTGDGSGLVGGDLWLPLNSNWSFQADYTYLLPQNTPGPGGNANEGWNLAFNMVWSPGLGRNYTPNYDRPLFNVANNGNFITKRRILP